LNVKETGDPINLTADAMDSLSIHPALVGISSNEVSVSLIQN